MSKISPVNLMRAARVLLLGLLLVAQGWADGMVVPGRGQMQLVDLSTVRAGRTIELEGDAIPVLAVHPQQSVLASVSATSGLRFWNLPDFSEASHFEDPLLEGIVDARFSADGARLFLLSQQLKAVLVYDLSGSKLDRVWPLPGSDPLALVGGEQGLGVLHKDGASLLDPSSGQLKAQFRFGVPVKGALLDSRITWLSVADGGGVSRFRADSGKRLASVGGGGAYAQLEKGSSGRYYLVHESESALEVWDGAAQSLVWSAELGQGPHYVLVSQDGRWVYALSLALKSMAVLEEASGKELGKLPIPSMQGRPVLYSGS